MEKQQHYDMVILGTGPAGLQAAIHASRKKVTVLVMGKETKSSLFHAHVENFCCLFKVSGEDMINTGREQAAGFGARFLNEDVLNVSTDNQTFKIKSESGSIIHCHTLIIATGTSRNRLGVPGEKGLLSKGVSYCVECDANFFKGERVAIVGNESAAADGALTLLEYASEVHLVCETLNVTDALANRIENSPIILYKGVKVKAIQGETQVERVTLSNGTVLDVSGVFIELGAKGVMELATALGIMLDDEMKYIRTGKKQETNIPGIYAAGDVCGPPWQMAKAVGEGCVAGIEAANYVKKLMG